MMVQPIASPSRPSVRFTALLEPTSTSITKTIKGRKASTPEMGHVQQRWNRQVGTEALDEGDHEAGGVAALVCIRTRARRRWRRRRETDSRSFGAGGQAQVAAMDHLDVVVGKSDGAEGQRWQNMASHTKGLDRSAQRNVGNRIAMQMSTPPMVGVPAFFWCALGPLRECTGRSETRAASR